LFNKMAKKEGRKYIALVALFSALVNVLYISPTIYMLQVYDRVVPTHGLQTLFYLTLIIIFALSSLSVLDRARMRLLVRAGVRLEMLLTRRLLDAVLGRPEFPSARQALRDLDMLRSTLAGPAILALFDVPWVPIYLIVCFLVHPWIGALAVGGSIVLPLIAMAQERATHKKVNEGQRTANASYAFQEALVNAAEAVRSLGMRRSLVARQLRLREAMVETNAETGLVSATFLAMGKFLRLALQSLALGLGAWLAVGNHISPGAIFAASFLIARALQPIEQLIASWKALIRAHQQYQDIQALLGSTPATRERTKLPAPTGQIKAEGLTILNRARDGAILQNVSFMIEAGEVIALVGPSGAGKSTLLRVLAGALLPDRGCVRFDGGDARDWDPDILASHIGYLPQDLQLMQGSVAENISRFAAEISEDKADIDARVVLAAQQVGADTLIRGLPQGYDHALGQSGEGLSAGQAQRLALARAVYGNPAILLLDEPNAHLDTEGDAALVAAVGDLKSKGKTVIIASHKTGILPVVDKILVLGRGQIDMFGPRDEILAKMSRPNLRPVAASPTAKPL
jgi:ATP-binding cassette subfamily C protein